MCYFHIVKACKERLRSYTADVQKNVLSDVRELHHSTSLAVFQERYRHYANRWSQDVPDFVTYFNNQWNRGDDFTNWKVFNSAPGIANTNNALESFNNLIKRNYTFHVRHPLPALLDLILDRLLFDLSMDVISKRSVYEIKRNPPPNIQNNVQDITPENYAIRHGVAVSHYTNKLTNNIYEVNVESSTCTCPSYYKHGFCKHLLHLHQKRNRDSSTIIINRRFKYQGNTKHEVELHMLLLLCSAIKCQVYN